MWRSDCVHGRALRPHPVWVLPPNSSEQDLKNNYTVYSDFHHAKTEGEREPRWVPLLVLNGCYQPFVIICSHLFAHNFRDFFVWQQSFFESSRNARSPATKGTTPSLGTAVARALLTLKVTNQIWRELLKARERQEWVEWSCCSWRIQQETEIKSSWKYFGN
jgi:hypothetical protein